MFDRERESAFHPRAFKIPKEDERSSYVRNIPIFSEDDASNLMRQTTSSVPKPVPPQQPQQQQAPSAQPSNEHPAGSRFNSFPGLSSSFPNKQPARNFPSNASDSGIDRAASNSPSDISDSASSASFPQRFPRQSRDTHSPPTFRQPKPTVDIEPPMRAEKVQTQDSAPPGRKDGEPIPMGFLPKQRNPSEAIPMGYDRPSSAPMDPPQKPDKVKPEPNAKVHRVPIVVKPLETPRSASAPPKPTETTPPPPPVKNPLDRIQEIISEVQKLEARVNQFTGTRDDHEYRLLDELLTQAVLKLDVVTTEGLDEVRNARKKAVKRVHDAIHLLETKTPAHKSTEKKDKKDSSPAAKGVSPVPEGGNTGPHRIVIAMNPEKEKKLDGEAVAVNQAKETFIN
ncbi:uncharacterized protein LOC129589232 isoform X2 [Paramacrobiotus metropolitanus]|uniref:uncharacterized protein LOC129589232 isoform X2 n=1 Tax=Paramacrobiotus metropolitanus TaxID=2943436 RepID=UPI00244640B5|nr:uncharacterized protein LOC129589232 isoform X2 [Paramacrobiotus metropolitanus]